MNRREFITLLGGATVAWPVAVTRAEVVRVRRIGILMGITESDPEGQARFLAFKNALAQVDLKDRHNIQLEVRWAGGDPNRTAAYAADLLALGPEAVLATNTATVRAFQKATKTIPVVFVSVSDPVGDGLVAGLAHPGGNITGFSSYEPGMVGKWVELLKEIAPAITRIAVLFNPTVDPHSLYLPPIKSAASALSVTMVPAPVQNADEIEQVIGSLGRERGAGLLTMPGSFTVVARTKIIQHAERYRLPALYPLRLFVSSGGLMSYGTDTVGQYQQAASYVGRILHGAGPSDLPVQQPTKFQLVINLKTARALGITVPATLLARADEVIE